ncbi:hypothetical protein RND81_11G127400 [Saponaria officinalis]|uniref:Transmembrane protein n=1 Tax=Saponaria officinalis TaxID=3572 RepID=A0AAW1HME2_SAPOF
MTCSVLSSQSMMITTAMAISGAVIFFSFYQIKNLPSIQKLPFNQNSSSHSPDSSHLRSCLSSEKLTGGSKKKKKRVKFADNVDEKWVDKNGEKKKNEGFFNREKKRTKFCGMPANRAALYHGILRDRVHRVEKT